MEIISTTTINKQKIDFNITDDKVFTTSLDIAKVFEKNHFHILRDIENLPNDKFRKSNFGLSMKLQEIEGFKGKNRAYKYYNLTRDGFALLAMGFTGEKGIGK